MKEVVSGISEVLAVDHMGDVQATVGNGREAGVLKVSQSHLKRSAG